VLLGLVVVVAGCAGPGADPAGDPVNTGTAAGSTAPATPDAGVAPATQPDSDQRPPVRVVATGRVEAGAAPGCLLLAGDQGRTWLLIGGDRTALAPGAHVQVVGEPADARTGGCRQGEPLRVLTVTPAG
jgi:Protein of unknown function (DUF5818)